MNRKQRRAAARKGLRDLTKKDARQFGERRIGSEIFYDIVDPLSLETVFAGAGRDFGDFDFERIVTEIVEQHNGVAANLTAVS